MAERQMHGFLYEKEIIERYNLTEEKVYNGKWDAYENDIPVSVKCICRGNSIDFGDVRRQWSINSDFILYIGFWEGDKTNIVEEYRIFIDKEKWRELFGNHSIFDEMIEELKNISNDMSDDIK